MDEGLNRVGLQVRIHSLEKLHVRCTEGLHCFANVIRSENLAIPQLALDQADVSQDTPLAINLEGQFIAFDYELGEPEQISLYDAIAQFGCDTVEAALSVGFGHVALELWRRDLLILK